jgi:hypothetical protein
MIKIILLLLYIYDFYQIKIYKKYIFNTKYLFYISYNKLQLIIMDIFLITYIQIL